MVPRVQDMQGSRRESNGADSDGGSWSSSDALTAEMLTMSGPTEEDAPAQKQIHVPDKRGIRKLLAYLGPGFLVAIAYIDPGNFESDLKAGADFKYELLWVLLLASIAGLIIQSLAANLGVVTGKHLSEHCRAEYPRHVNHALWIVAELAIVASDIPEVIGTAFALQMLFGIPLWIGVILTGFSTLILLALQNYGVRKLEIFISVLVFMIASCFFFELYFARPSAAEILQGMFVPKLNGSHATAIAVSLLGAVVMPHNLYLHSALVLTRKVPRTARGIKDGCRFNFLECSFALFLAFAINVSVIAVSGAVCSRPTLSPSDLDNCQNIDLDRTPFLLQNVLGDWSRELFAIALLASGQSSTITGTYAGQYVMQGFLELRFKPWLRNLVTRAVAIVPSLAVAMIGGSSGAGQLIIISSMILSFELPFALLPLLKFTSSPVKMGPFTNHSTVTLATWVIGFFVIGVNCYFLGSLGIEYLRTSELHTGLVVLVGIIMFASMFVYLVCLLYLALRKDSEITYVHPDFEEGGEMLQSNVIGDDDLGGRFGPLPREDIAHMQLGSPRARDGLLSELEGSEVVPLDREGYRRKHGLISDQVGPD